MEFFSDSPLDDLIAEFPDWLRADDPAAELYKWLDAIAQLHADLDATAEQVYADTALGTASLAGLLAEWAYVFDVRPDVSSGNFTADQVRAYLRAWIACNGSSASLVNLLLAVILLDTRNLLYGPIATFDAGGAGLTFPANGSGIGPLYQFATAPDPIAGFIFPLDGSGLTFPDPALHFPGDGTGLTLSAVNFPNFTSLTFPNGAPWVTVTENFTNYGLTVTIKTWLSFDRGAIRRVIDRFRQAHTTPTVYVETN